MIASQNIVTIKKGGGSYRPVPDITVINDDLIRQAMKKYYEENKEEYKIVNLDTMPFNELRVLNLSFQDIYRIQNLEGLNRLEELRLDNNKIKKIENIGHLVHLKWLDLSFNLIEKIEGLSELKKVQDISLYSNQIKEVEGLDQCVELNVLSIGNNQIDKYDKMLEYLKKFRKLEVLNVAGNPFTKKEHEYDLYIILKLNGLKYLDHSFIDDAMKNKLKEKDEFQGEMLKRQEEIKELEEQDKVDKVEADELKKLKEAKVETLENIIAETFNDPDFEKLANIRGAQKAVEDFKEKFDANGKLLKAAIIEKNESKLEQINKFLTELRGSIRGSEDETKGYITRFQKRMKDTFRKFENPDYDDEKELFDLREDTQGLEDQLLDIEMQFVEMEDNSIKQFGFQLDDCGKDMNRIVVEIFEKFKSDLGVLKANIMKVTLEELDRYQDYTSAENPPEGGSDYTVEQEFFLDNRDGVLGVVSQFIENVEGRIFKKETEITEAITKFTKDFCDNLREEQYERNRRNVNNIISLMVKLREQIDKQLRQDDDDDASMSNR